MRGHLLVTICASAAIACGTDFHPPKPPDNFTGDPPQVYVAKVKNILTGLPPTDAEIQAVVNDPTALGGLVDQWMATPEYTQKMIVFLELAFQQTQIGEGDYVTYFNPYLNQGLTSGGYPAQRDLLFENLRESFARTVLAFAAQGRPFTDALSSHQLMMTPALMEFYALADWFQETGEPNAFGANDMFATANAGKTITIEGTTPIAIAASVNPADPNYLHFYNPDVAKAHAANANCPDPRTFKVGAQAVHEVLYGGVAGFSQPVQCNGITGTAQNTYMLPTDFTTWNLVTVRPPNAGEQRTPFLDVGALRSATELVLATPHVGFMTPAFFVNWPTNKSNQARVTLNQALIIATGTAIDGTDPTNPGANPPGLDAAHASASGACLGCHQLLDPTRSIVTATYNYFYRQQTDAALMAVPGLFAFQGVVQPMKTLDDFGSLLATHPLVGLGWTQKLCYYVNSAACDPSDPELQRIVSDFQSSGMSWNTLVKDVMTSPITTNASETKTWHTNGEVVAVSRRDHLCAALNNRLGFVDICQLDPTTHYGVGTTALASIVSGMPSDGYGRGAVAPILPNQPTLFYRAAVEQVCTIVAQATIDAKVDPHQPGAKQWSSAKPDAAIADFVAIVMALAPSDPRSARIAQVLTSHFQNATMQGATPTTALQSTFITACLSPSFIGVGM